MQAYDDLSASLFALGHVAAVFRSLIPQPDPRRRTVVRRGVTLALITALVANVLVETVVRQVGPHGDRWSCYTFGAGAWPRFLRLSLDRGSSLPVNADRSISKVSVIPTTQVFASIMRIDGSSRVTG
jgi:hypothetical protein